jgi:hypothetical protein
VVCLKNLKQIVNEKELVVWRVGILELERVIEI